MKLATVFTAVYALALTSTATPVPGLDKRVSWPCGGTGPCPILISEFTLFSTTNDCDAADAIGTFTYYKGYDSDKCHSVSELAGAATGVFGVSEIDGDKKCQLIVFRTTDCSDSGAEIGITTPNPKPGCFSDAAGIQGFKVQCPWWN